MTEEKAVKARHVGELKFPQDKSGNLSRTKTEALKAIAKMHGSIEKYRTLQDTLDMLKEFAETRMKVQLAERKAAVAASRAREMVVTGDGSPVIAPATPDAAEPAPDAKEPAKPKEPANPAVPVAGANPNGNQSATGQ